MLMSRLEFPLGYLIFKETFPRIGGGGTWVNFSRGYVPLASQGPFPVTFYSVANYRPQVSHFKANM